MIKGRKVGLNQAIKEIKNLIKDSEEIHIDGLNCDQLSIYIMWEGELLKLLK